MRTKGTIVMAMLLALAAPVSAQTPAPGGPVAVLVAVPIPPGMPRATLISEFEKSVPIYQALPGLVRKYFTIGDDNRAGGIYLWQSRGAAQSFFSEAWRGKVQARWGASPEVVYFDAPVVTEGTVPRAAAR